MVRRRASGILLHPTSLPGPYGIGDLGPEAHRWIEFLARAGQKLWQLLPLGPTGFGDSPYQSFSAFAGNLNLLSPDALFEDGLLTRAERDELPRLPEGTADFERAGTLKRAALKRAYRRFRADSGALHEEFESFSSRHERWLDDFALFMALREALGQSWWEWDEPLALRDPAALAAAAERLADEVDAERFGQFLFLRQWAALRAHARRHGIEILGDMPIFVSIDSADVWAHRELFALDRHGRPTVVAGVPPDYFSENGQLWGNPLYRWDALERTGYAWWIDRFRAILECVDVARVDHFRGFVAHWEIPADAETARDGRWVPGPGRKLFDALRAALGDLPIIAEDLGEITPDVPELRDALGLPGMKVLHFAFSGEPDNPFLPHNYDPCFVVYTGTHDNDTTRGWYENSSTPAERDQARRYLARDGEDIAWDLIRLAFASVAERAIVPLQDVLDLGSEARMNLPGRLTGNWGWRFRAEQLTPAIEARLRDLTALYGR